MKITDEKLLRIALVTSLIGIIGLIIFTPSIEIKEIDIEDINRGMIDEEVKFDCVITEIMQSNSGSSYFLTVTDGTGQIIIIIFENQLTEIESSNMDIDNFKDRHVEITGKITEYNSNLEVILSNGNGLKII